MLKPRPLGKTELARQYLGDGYSSSACRQWLNREINSCPELQQLLKSLGYRTSQKVFTVAQVHAIYYVLGEPG